MNFLDEIEIYLRARFTVLWIASYEEERILAALREVCEQRKPQRLLFDWDVATYFRLIFDPGDAKVPDARDPRSALDRIAQADKDRDAVFVLKDFHHCLAKDPVLQRQLRNLAQALKATRKTVIITSPVSKLPEDLTDDISLIEFSPPGVQEMDGILNRLVQNPSVTVDLTEPGRDKVLRSALGLSSNQALRVFGKSIVTPIDAVGRMKLSGTLDESAIDTITAEKKTIIRSTGALEYFAPSETIDDVGGLDLLKAWLEQRGQAFTQAACKYGLDAPKGIALIGIPGTGKSLTAKMVANLWHLPLIRLDVAALFTGLVGASEENTRRALAQVGSIAPCVLWIDEMEKAFAQGGLDGGTSQRVFGNILTWLQEKRQPVFVIGTANDVSALRPEMLRAGRFDAVFFLDLPTTAERQAIFEVHIKKKRPIEGFDTTALAVASGPAPGEQDGATYVGSEIEQAVKDAMHIAFNDGQREFTTDDIRAALKKLVPLCRSQKEEIKLLQQWLTEDRARPASSPETRSQPPGGPVLQTD